MNNTEIDSAANTYTNGILKDRSEGDYGGGTGGSSGTSTVTINGTSGSSFTISKSTVGLSNVTNDAQVKASEKGVASGVATLDTSGKVPVSQVPNVNAEIKSVADKPARLALATNTTNLMIVLQADTKWMWAINKGQNPATEANWIDCGSTVAAVVSVNGSTGAVTISCSTLGAVPTTTKVNGKALSGDVTLTLTDLFTVGADTSKFFRYDGTWASPTIAGNALSYYKANGASLNSITVNSTNITFPTLELSKGTSINYNSGIFTLAAGKTYRLRFSPGIINYSGASASNGFSIWQFYNITTGAAVGLSGSSNAISRATLPVNEDKVPITEYTFAPTVSTQVAVRMVNPSAGVTGMLNYWIEIEELPQSSTTVIPAGSTTVTEWQPYNPTIGGTTTAPTLATTKTLKGAYKVIGKTLYIKFTYHAASATGAAAGSGAYTISLPSGFTIDTALVGVPSTISGASGNVTPGDCLSLGSGASGNNFITIVALSTTTLGMYVETESGYIGLIGSILDPVNLSANTVYQFTAEVPIV